METSEIVPLSLFRLTRMIVSVRSAPSCSPPPVPSSRKLVLLPASSSRSAPADSRIALKSMLAIALTIAVHNRMTIITDAIIEMLIVCFLFLLIMGDILLKKKFRAIESFIKHLTLYLDLLEFGGYILI